MSTGLFCCPDLVQLDAVSHGCASHEAGDGREPVADAPLGADATGSLTCLYSHNSTEEDLQELPDWATEEQEDSLPDAWNIVTGAHRQSAFALGEDLMGMGEFYGVQRLGFQLLTFAPPEPTFKEAKRRFNSLATHVISKRFERAIAVWERGDLNHRLHCHLAVVLPEDIRTGYDHRKGRRRQSASPFLKAEWAFWEETCPLYKFGTPTLEPVKSNNAQAFARYLGGYLCQGIRERFKVDLGYRRVSYLGFKKKDGGYRRRVKGSCMRLTQGTWLWRKKVGKWALRAGMKNMEEVHQRCGPRWARKYRGEILSMHIDEVYPSAALAEKAARMEEPARRAEAIVKELMTRPDFMKRYLEQPLKDYRVQKKEAA